MTKLILFLIFFLLIIGVIVSALKNSSSRIIVRVNEITNIAEMQSQYLSMKQIDSLTAATNIRFIKVQD